MKQLTYVSAGVLEWREVPDPRLQSDGDALVRPLVVTRCDLDLSIATGAAGWPGGFALGHETYGEVVDVGDAVTGFRPGDRVLVPFQISCGACRRCRAGLTALCETVPYRSSYGMAPLSGVDYGGSLSDLLRVPFADHMLVAAPDDLTPEAMAGVADNITNAYAFVADPLRERPGSAFLIVGGARGGIALHAIQCALGLGAEKVVYVGAEAVTLEMAARLGAETVALEVGPDTPAVGQFPFTLDASGSEDGLAFAIRCTDYEGLCQRTYGDFVDRTPTPLKDMYGRNITLKLGRVHARAHMPATLDLMRRGCLCPEHVITRRAPFCEAVDAMLDPTQKVVFVNEAASPTPPARVAALDRGHVRVRRPRPPGLLRPRCLPHGRRAGRRAGLPDRPRAARRDPPRRLPRAAPTGAHRADRRIRSAREHRLPRGGAGLRRLGSRPHRDLDQPPDRAALP